MADCYCDVEESAEGDYVEYSDVEKLLAALQRKDEVIERVDALLQATACELFDILKATQAELERK